MISIIIIGCGRIFEKHANSIQAFRKFKVVAVVDNDNIKLKAAEKKFKCKGYNNLKKIENDFRADLAIILTPSGLHASHASIISKYVNTIVVEKPVCLSLPDLFNLQKLNKKGIQVFVVKQNRYNLPILEMQQFLKREKEKYPIYGTIRLRWCRDKKYYQQAKWRGTWEFDGGVLSNQASHHIDILLMFMGDVKTVYATSICSEPSIEVENTAIVNLVFQNNTIAVIEASTAIRPNNLEASISLIFRDYVAEIGGHALNKWEILPPKLKSKISDKSQLEISDVYGEGHLSFYKELEKYFDGKSYNLVEISEAGKTVTLLNAIYESIETGLPVEVTGKFKNSKLGRTNAKN